MVISIPLSKMDKLIWRKSVIGQLFVKFVYFKACTTLGKEINLYEERSPIWRSIWIAKVIPKIKMFL